MNTLQQHMIRYEAPDAETFFDALVDYAKSFDVHCMLYTGFHHSQHTVSDTYSFLVGLGEQQCYSANSGHEVFHDLENAPGIKLGYIAYEYAFDTQFKTPNPANVPPPFQTYWFTPECLVYKKHQEKDIVISGPNPEKILAEILKRISLSHLPPFFLPQLFKPLVSPDSYIQQVEQIMEDITQGDYYELNYCQEFLCHDFVEDPYKVWKNSYSHNKVPFASFFRFKDFYVISSSPERFIKREGANLFSQPMKGTQRRSPNPEEDTLLIKQLQDNQKERAENIMIVDLVRNDMCRCCMPGTVNVDELCKVYTFPTVHQMISTISGKLKQPVSLAEVLQYLFPMGSMTGAPKKMVMERIAKYEQYGRGVYSGAIGYIDDDHNWDLNVVIRTLVVNTQLQKASYHVGGAITFDSTPEQEYLECMLKGRFWQSLFGNK
jgi:para-aminobenzoate synthetase component I